jgi:C1A family cysteine protease
MIEAFPYRLGGWSPSPDNDKNGKPHDDYCFAADLKPMLSAVQPTNVLTVGRVTKLVERTPIGNQGQLGSCVANGTCDGCELIMPAVIQLSRLFVYYNARNYDGTTKEDRGTYVRNAFASIADIGVCPELGENSWPYDTSRVFFQPPDYCYVAADSNKINGYYRIKAKGDDRIAEIKSAIDSGHPVVFGTLVGSNWMNNSGAETVQIPTKQELMTGGGHCMVITGYSLDDNGEIEALLIRNSWGTGWGMKGYGWMSRAYIAWSSTEDLWVPTLVPTIKTQNKKAA